MSVKNFALLMLVAFAAALIFIPPGGYGYDTECFQRWTIFIRTTGLGHAYELPDLDYNPLFLELLWVFGRVQGSVEALQTSFFTFKIFVLLFHFGAVALAAHLLRRNGRNIALAALVLFNPAFLYNSVIWGQVDSIFTLFVGLSLFLATRKRVLASLLCVLLAVNFKLVAVVFVPYVVLLNLPAIREAIREDRKGLLRTLGVLLAIQVLILLPFLDRQSLLAIVAANQRQMQAQHVTSPSGFNFWFLVFGDRAAIVPAATTFLHVSFKTWGIVMFAVAAAAILAPAFKTTVLRRAPLADADVFLAGSLYGLAFFFFTTGMHERYSHAAMLLLAVCAVLSGSYLGYVLGSIAYFINLEWSTKYFHLATYETLTFKGSFVGALFLVVLVLGVLKIYPLPRSARNSSYVLM